MFIVVEPTVVIDTDEDGYLIQRVVEIPRNELSVLMAREGHDGEVMLSPNHTECAESLIYAMDNDAPYDIIKNLMLAGF